MYFSCNSTTANTHPVGKYLLSHGPPCICLFVSYSSIYSLSIALQTWAQFLTGRCKHIKVFHVAGSRAPPIWFMGQNIDENKHKTSDWYHIKGKIFGWRMKRSTMLLYVFEKDKSGYWFGTNIKSDPDLMPFSSATGGTTRWRMPVKCTPEQPTCLKWPRTGVVGDT